MLPRIRGKYRLRIITYPQGFISLFKEIENDPQREYFCAFQIDKKQMWWWKKVRSFPNWFDAIDFFDQKTKETTNEKTN